MKHILSFYKTHGYTILVIAVIGLAAVLRFYNYFNRWGLAFDQAHDVIIARYALAAHKLPLLGPFSSAGPFQTGGEWYWFIMAGALVLPFSILGPWIFLTFLQVCFTGLMMYVGYKMIGKWYGMLVGLFSAISPIGISQSINLTNQSLLNIIAAIAILFAVLSIKYPKTKYLFWLGFFSTLGATIHLQGVPLVGLAIGVVILDRLRNKKGLFFLALGGLLPLIPLIYVDVTNHFFNVGHMIQYYFHDQYKISLNVLGRRWQTYISTLWPHLWNGAIGGNNWVGFTLMGGSLLLLLGAIYKRVVTKQWILLVGVFLFAFTLIRYTRTPIFDNYVMFLHPFIFLFTGALCYYLLKKYWFLGAILVCVTCFYSLQSDITQIKAGTNYMAYRASSWNNMLREKYKSQSVALYDYKYQSTGYTFPFLMYLQYTNHISNTGHRIGFGLPAIQDARGHNFYMDLIISENTTGFTLVDLQGSSSAELQRAQWVFITPQKVYDTTEDWYNNKH